MSRDAGGADRSGVAIAIAAAAVTLAAGITVGALTGYLGPAGAPPEEPALRAVVPAPTPEPEIVYADVPAPGARGLSEHDEHDEHERDEDDDDDDD